MCEVAIIGAGVAGSSVAIYLANLGVNVTLFEKNNSLVDGPPMCHLHAGGNLYREISLSQCKQLLKESIELLRMYPYAIDFRPTIIATPITDEDDPQNQIKKLEYLKEEYKKLIEIDPKNKVLGEVDDYYKVFYKEDLEKLRNHFVDTPKIPDDWIAPFARNVDLDKIKYPVILVNEYGLNVFRIGSNASLILEKLNANVLLNTEVIDVKKENKFIVTYKKDNKTYTKKFDYVINSAGFLSGEIDNFLGHKKERFVEFKAAYVTKWENNEKYWPEIIFHGTRGTPEGMGQFTPYYGNYFQIHAMTEDITLFKNGLVKTTNDSQPKVKKEFLDILNKGWNENIVKDRTKKAINHINKFMPQFDSDEYYKPLFGFQQIPGDDETLRAAEVSFEESYARCEIVKASSVFAMADEIVKKLINMNCLDKNSYISRDFNFKLNKEDVNKLAMKLAENRDYPREMGKVLFTYLATT